ncbi:hypothetical protein ACO2Q2_13330 [Dyella sp. KRB-257]|uniref:hypothetical protein n=1 Tax=Dyella sp. KRB-257 TaxID=3400915 RepID=UPI003C006326
MARRVPIGSFNTGITRLREKGGARPDSLYDLVNGYINAAGAPVSRFGTRVQHTLPAGTKGLCIFKGKRHVFAMSAIDPGSTDYVVDILIHPDPAFAGTLVAIHFAKPFLGYLYVVAEFSDGKVFHYYLEANNAWQASTFYKIGDTVRPTTINGFVYTPTSQSNPPAWSPDTTYAIGDVVQPSQYNGYEYTVVDATGSPAKSGSSEPNWTASSGALVYDDSSGTTAPASTTAASTGHDSARYGNLIGAKTYKTDGSTP